MKTSRCVADVASTVLLVLTVPDAVYTVAKRRCLGESATHFRRPSRKKSYPEPLLDTYRQVLGTLRTCEALFVGMKPP